MSDIHFNRQTTTFTAIEKSFQQEANRKDSGIRLHNGNLTVQHTKGNKSDHAQKKEAKLALLKSIENEYGSKVKQAVTEKCKLFNSKWKDPKITPNNLSEIRQTIEQSRISREESIITRSKMKEIVCEDSVTDILAKQHSSVKPSGGEGFNGVLFILNENQERTAVVKPLGSLLPSLHNNDLESCTDEIALTEKLQTCYETLQKGMDKSLPFSLPVVRAMGDTETTLVKQHIDHALETDQSLDIHDRGRMEGWSKDLGDGSKKLLQMEKLEGTTISQFSTKKQDLPKLMSGMYTLGKSVPFCALLGLKDHTLANDYAMFNTENFLFTDEGEMKLMDPDITGNNATYGQPGFRPQELTLAFKEAAELISLGGDLKESMLKVVQDGNTSSLGVSDHGFKLLNGFLRSFNEGNLQNLSDKDKAQALTNVVIGMYEGMRDISENSEVIANILDQVNEGAGKLALHRSQDIDQFQNKLHLKDPQYDQPMTGIQFTGLLNAQFSQINGTTASNATQQII